MCYHAQLIQTTVNPENESASKVTLIVQKPQKQPGPGLAPGP